MTSPPQEGARRLVITADDFGASREVNAAVERAHRDGVLTAASLMVSGDASADAVARARAMPELGVGLHLVLVEGRPVLPSDQLPALVDRTTGRFRSEMARTAVRIFASPAARAQLAAEVEAQFAAFAATGLPLDHVNAHKHFHLHPTIASAVLRVGRRYGMRAVRTPVEDRAVLRHVEPVAPGGRVENLTARLLRRRLRRAGLVVPDQVLGLAWTGAVDTERLRGLIEHLPPGLTEIYTHPATGPYPGAAPGYRYADELAALLDPLAKERLARRAIMLGDFRRFASSDFAG